MLYQKRRSQFFRYSSNIFCISQNYGVYSITLNTTADLLNLQSTKRLVKVALFLCQQGLCNMIQQLKF